VRGGVTNVLDHARKLLWSSTGMPRTSAMTVIGSGNAKSSTSSIRPRSATRSTSPSAISRMRGRSCSTNRGVNAVVTSRRKRRWSSPSSARRFVFTRSSGSGMELAARRSASSSGVKARAGSSTNRPLSVRRATTSS
jgi:hypothetical protein